MYCLGVTHSREAVSAHRLALEGELDLLLHGNELSFLRQHALYASPVIREVLKRVTMAHLGRVVVFLQVFLELRGKRFAIFAMRPPHHGIQHIESFDGFHVAGEGCWSFFATLDPFAQVLFVGVPHAIKLILLVVAQAFHPEGSFSGIGAPNGISGMETAHLHLVSES